MKKARISAAFVIGLMIVVLLASVTVYLLITDYDPSPIRFTDSGSNISTAYNYGGYVVLKRDFWCKQHLLAVDWRSLGNQKVTMQFRTTGAEITIASNKDGSASVAVKSKGPAAVIDVNKLDGLKLNTGEMLKVDLEDTGFSIDTLSCPSGLSVKLGDSSN